MLSKIVDGVYLGCSKDVKRSDELRSLGITHILTIDDRPLNKELQEQYTCKWIHACDTEQDDLLTHFDSCISFMANALVSGQALIQCRHGVSRSATVAIAYLMQKTQLTAKEAFVHVKKIKTDVCPNEGFVNQLKLFETMKCHVDVTQPVYKQFRLNLLSSQIQTAKAMCEVPDEMMSADPAVNPQSSHGHTFKCKKCRRILFRSGSVLEHTTGVGEAAFDWRVNHLKHDGIDHGGDTCTQSLFVEPLKWMKKWIINIEGKLSCPKCDSKLGSFNWIGERCPCGQWVTPAFHIQKNKVDESKPVMALQQHARQPAGLQQETRSPASS